MEHSNNYEKVKNWFHFGVWNEARVRNAVKVGWITEAEFEEITGKIAGQEQADEILA